jgi:hypothetical protein
VSSWPLTRTSEDGGPTIHIPAATIRCTLLFRSYEAVYALPIMNGKGLRLEMARLSDAQPALMILATRGSPTALPGRQ